MLNSALHFQITQLRKTTIIYQFVVGNKALEDCFLRIVIKIVGFPNGSAGKESACNAGDTVYVGLIPRSGRSPGVGNGNPL